MFGHELNLAHFDGSVFERKLQLRGTAQDGRKIALTPNEKDLYIKQSFQLASVTLLLIYCDRDITIRTNHPEPAPIDPAVQPPAPIQPAPQDVLHRPAGVPFLFYHGCGFELQNVFADNVTAFYVTNETDQDARLEIRCLQ